MQIETYEIEELKGECETLAADSESIELINKLGLTGQKELVEPTSETRFPYPLMTQEQFNVYSLVCPEKTKLDKFNGGIIPLRILQVAAFCKEMPQIHHIEVWHPKNIKDDPILVGNTGEWSSKVYLLGRWGEHLAPFAELMEKAKRLWVSKTRQALSEIKHDLSLYDSDEALMRKADERFAGDDVSQPKFYW